MLTHWFDNEMGGKPYLAIEVDEHSSLVGVMTRLEAFANSVSGRDAKHEKGSARVSAFNENKIQCNIDAVSKKIPLAIPSLYPYSTLLTASLIQKGYSAEEMPPASGQSLAKGRVLMRGKEYFTLTALLGDCIEYAGKSNMSQLLIPQNNGAENDGLYARFIATKLDEQMYGNTTVVAPVWEHLIKEKATADALFSISLARDIMLCASLSKQAKLLSEMRAAFASGLPTEKYFIK
jgi:hypothetical protein